jgi:hypothetical protein
LPESHWRKNIAAQDQRGTEQDESAFHLLPIPSYPSVAISAQPSQSVLFGRRGEMQTIL